MKLLVIGSRVPYPLKDGGAIAAYNHLKGFAEAGAEVSLFALNTNKHFVSPEVLDRQFAFLNRVETFPINTDIRAFDALISVLNRSSYNVERFYCQKAEAALEEHLAEYEYDVIQFEGLYTSMYIRAVSKVSDAKLVLRQHNVEYQIWQRLASVEKNPLKKLYLKLLAKRLKEFEENIIPEFDAVVAITDNDKAVFEKLTDKPLVCSPAGINVVQATAFTAPSERVYHIGSMEWMPNCEAVEWFVKDVWPLVLQQQPAAKFYMAGKHMPETYMQWNSNSVSVAGEVESASEFISDKGIMVVPLRSGSGIRMKTLEAMAAGKAVVSTSTGIQGIDCIPGKQVLIADTAADFAAALLRLINDASLRQQLAQDAQQFVSAKYDNRILIRQLLDFYRKLEA